MTSKDMTPVRSDRNIGFKRPWWAVREIHHPNIDIPSDTHLTVRININTENSTRPRTYRLGFPDRQSRMFAEHTKIVHSSVEDNVLLVTLCRNTLARDSDTVTNRKQLFFALFLLTDDAIISSVLTPVLCEQLTKPLETITLPVDLEDQFDDHNDDDSDFGKGIRSRNGRVVALVTSLPFESRETAEISVYELFETNNNPRWSQTNVISIPWSDLVGCDKISMALSNGGELLSVQLIHKSFSPLYRSPILLSWRLYTLRSTSTSGGEDADSERNPQPITIAVESNTRLFGHWFSPDNELWVSIRTKGNQNRSLAQYCRNIRAPSWFSSRIVIVENKRMDSDPLLLP